jgi:hypothetical protein
MKLPLLFLPLGLGKRIVMGVFLIEDLSGGIKISEAKN